MGKPDSRKAEQGSTAKAARLAAVLLAFALATFTAQEAQADCETPGCRAIERFFDPLGLMRILQPREVSAETALTDSAANAPCPGAGCPAMSYVAMARPLRMTATPAVVAAEAVAVKVETAPLAGIRSVRGLLGRQFKALGF
jgi:hypothetical protein